MKRILILLCLLFFQAQGAQNLYVKSLQEYNSVLPNQKFRVEVLEDVFIGSIPIVRGDILNCSLKQIKSPKRAKRDARIYFEIISYEDIKGVHKFQDKIVAKYAKKVLSKDSIKEISPKEAAIKTAGTVGGFFVTGFSQAVSFVNGVVKNEEENRLKSGVQEVYDNSILSYVEYGNEVIISEGDKFYLIAKVVEE